MFQIVNTVVGIGLIALRSIRRNAGQSSDSAPAALTVERPPRAVAGADVQSIIDRQVSLRDRVEFIGGADVGFDVSGDSLKQMVSTVLEMATSHSNAKKLRVYLTTLPGVDRIVISAEYCANETLPRVRWLGRTDKECSINTSGWPQNCSAAFFDNGFEYIYSISISKRSI